MEFFVDYGADFGSNRHFPGVIDEVRFWKGALTEAEIQDSMGKSITAVDAAGQLGVAWGRIKAKR